MRHRRTGRILGRRLNQRRALLRSLMRAVVLSDRITTTESRAKELRPHLERLITKEKTGTLAHHRYVVSEIGIDAASRLKKEILPKIGGRSSGFVRITKRPNRRSDAAQMVTLGFVD